MGSNEEPVSRAGRERLRLAALLGAAALLVAFVIDNTQSTRVGFVFFERTPPLIYVLLVTAVLGAVVDRLVRWLRKR